MSIIYSQTYQVENAAITCFLKNTKAGVCDLVIFVSTKICKFNSNIWKIFFFKSGNIFSLLQKWLF